MVSKYNKTKHILNFTFVVNKFGKSNFKPTMVFDYNNNMSAGNWYMQSRSDD